jgi:hypothetical protein
LIEDMMELVYRLEYTGGESTKTCVHPLIGPAARLL